MVMTEGIAVPDVKSMVDRYVAKKHVRTGVETWRRTGVTDPQLSARCDCTCGQVLLTFVPMEGDSDEHISAAGDVAEDVIERLHAEHCSRMRASHLAWMLAGDEMDRATVRAMLLRDRLGEAIASRTRRIRRAVGRHGEDAITRLSAWELSRSVSAVPDASEHRPVPWEFDAWWAEHDDADDRWIAGVVPKRCVWARFDQECDATELAACTQCLPQNSGGP